MADRPVRILMLAPTPYFADRGCHVRIYEEARALRSRGHDVRIVTYHIGRDLPDVPVYRIPQIPWYNRLEAGPSWHKLYLDLLLLCKSLLVIPDFRPDLIHAHLHEGAGIGYVLKKITGLPLVLDYQGSLTGECIDHGFFKAESAVGRCFALVEQLIDSCVDRIVTSSGSGAADLVHKWGVPPQRVTPLIDAVDTEIFRPAPTGEGRKMLGIPPDAFVVGYLGLLNRYQGTDLLLESIHLLQQAGIDAHFLIMGFPEERYRTEARRLGVDGMITFTGKVDYSLAPLMLSAADIAVTPKLSPTEANGKIFNYMACALPVIAFDTPVNREVLGDTGVYAEYGSARSLADRIAEMARDRAVRERLSRSVRDRASREHSWETRGRALEALYRELLSQR